MMKIKRNKIWISIGVILISLLAMPIVTGDAKASTLRGLRQELNALERKYNSNQNTKAKTQAEINQAKNNIFNSQLEITKNQKLNEEAQIEIQATSIEIAKTEDSIKDLMRNHQLTNSGNMSMEYIFNAENYADLVYRYAVAEQIASASARKIDEYEKAIEKNEQLKIDLQNREKELDRLIDVMQDNMVSLGDKIKMIDEEAIDIKTDIKTARDFIKTLENMKCKEDQDIEECLAMNDSKFFMRPLTKGTITSNFGYRKHPVTGVVNSFHSGIDIGGNAEGTNVYAVASGTVGKILAKQSCGGNMVYIYHTVNGKKYTSTAMHLLKVNVKLGQKVTASTVIGTIGGGKGTPWDWCSTGAHLHLSIATGWYGTACSNGCYTLYSTWKANLVNPRPLFNFPALNGKFTSRLV